MSKKPELDLDEVMKTQLLTEEELDIAAGGSNVATMGSLYYMNRPGSSDVPNTQPEPAKSVIGNFTPLNPNKNPVSMYIPKPTRATLNIEQLMAETPKSEN
ncbi:MAG: hypothetical protein WCP79_13885 [Bacillota bacterium]